MNDLAKCLAECRERQAAGKEISDGCARAIAGRRYSPSGPSGEAFAATGAIDSPRKVWNDLFGKPASFYSSMGEQKILADMLGSYLVRAGKRGPVPGWEGIWIE